MAHLSIVAICPALSENLRDPLQKGSSARGISGWLGVGIPRDSAHRFHDNAETQKTNVGVGMAVSRNQKKDRFQNLMSRLEVVSWADGFLMTVGPVTLLLDREAAEKLACLLADVLEPSGTSDIDRTGSN